MCRADSRKDTKTSFFIPRPSIQPNDDLYAFLVLSVVNDLCDQALHDGGFKRGIVLSLELDLSARQLE